MERILKIVLFVLLVGGVPAKAQNLESAAIPKDKKKIELRPNSLDYGAVKRDNFNQRIERKRDKSLYVHKRPMAKKQAIKPANKKEIKKSQRIQRQKQTIKQRRKLNR